VLGQGLPLGLAVAEDGDIGEAAEDDVSLLDPIVRIVLLGDGRAGPEDVEGAFATSDVASDLEPLPEAPSIDVAMESGDEPVAVAPLEGGEAGVSAIEKHLGESAG
jgi:hypothetical protein